LFQFDPATAEDYPRLLERLNAIEDKQGVCMNRLYYLSIPPELFNQAVHNIGEAGLNTSCQHGNAATRLLVEKPFGSDLNSAKSLIEKTNAVFNEEQIFRIDHYLAKETVQNILSFRVYNPIFTSIWDGAHIEHIFIKAHEKIGIEGRVNFYEGLGALRDLIQSHLLQLAAVTTMELPETLSSDHIHAARTKMLESIPPVDPGQASRGQYDSYKTEVDNPQSTTETFARLVLKLDTERWQGIPLTIETGKALSEKRTEIAVTFRNPQSEAAATNTLMFRIQPNEGIHLELFVKRPGFKTEHQSATLDFSYQQTFGNGGNHPNAYERVLVDAVRGDRTLFATSEEVLASWRIIEPLIEAWRDNDTDLQIYKSGSSGPGLVQ
jgi:glucose-6-phosphate 1-dehydrogenase